MNASQASRCACSELNSCSSPSSGICGCRSHSEPLRSAVCCCPLTSSSAGLGADQSARPLGQAKEPRARPMRSGDPLGDHGQRAIMSALIFEPVLAKEDGVGVSAPPTHQCRACPQYDTGIGGPAALLELSGQRLQATLLRPACPAMGFLLQPMSKSSDQQIATETLRRSGAMQFAPSHS